MSVLRLVRSAMHVLTLVTGLAATTTATAADMIDLRIGWQKGTTLAIIKAQGAFEKRFADRAIDIQ